MGGTVTITPDAAPAPPITITPDAPKPTWIDRGNELAGKALTAAGLPTSISNVPDWFAHFIGAAKDSKPFWESFKKAVEEPTQENIVNAVPFIGPAAVAMSQDARKGDYLGSLATLAGTVAGARGAQEIGPGSSAAKQELIDSRDIVSKITNRVAEHSLTAAAINELLPGAKETTNFHGGAYSDFAGESGKAVPVTKSPVPGGYKGPASVPKLTVAGPNSPVIKLADLSDESEGRPATWKNKSVVQLASAGGPLTRDAAVQAQLRQLDVPNVGLVADPNASMAPSVGAAKSVTRFDAQGKPITETPTAAYRVRSQGEEGIPVGGAKNNGAHATTTLADAERLAPGRESVMGEPQEIVKTDLTKLKEGVDYEVIRREGQAPWIRYLKPVPESAVSVVPKG